MMMIGKRLLLGSAAAELSDSLTYTLLLGYFRTCLPGRLYSGFDEGTGSDARRVHGGKSRLQRFGGFDLTVILVHGFSVNQCRTMDQAGGRRQLSLLLAQR